MLEGSRRRWAIVAAAGGGLAVAISAFGAHGLRGWLEQQSDLPAAEMARRLEVFNLGAQYQLLHSLAILATAALPGVRIRLACWLWLVGLAIFSGFLYLFAVTGNRTWAMPVPVGGTALILGWFALLVGLLRSK